MWALVAVAAQVGEVGELVGDDGGLLGEGVEALGDADEGQGVGQVAGLVVVGVVFEGLDGLRRFSWRPWRSPFGGSPLGVLVDGTPMRAALRAGSSPG